MGTVVVIVAAGGDGTYQEVINGMLQAVPDARTNGQLVGHLGALAVGLLAGAAGGMAFNAIVR